MGTARASAMAGPLPDMIAKAVPNTPPVITSGGIAAPTLIFPMKINSSVAPMIVPWPRSPRTNPTNGPKTNGLLMSEVPRKSSE